MGRPMAHMDYGGHAMSQGKDILETQLELSIQHFPLLIFNIRPLKKVIKTCRNFFFSLPNNKVNFFHQLTIF